MEHQENRRLRRELAQAREENAPVEPSPASSKTDHEGESTQRKLQDLQSEVMRLRGAASRAARAEAELAQLKSELEQQRARVGSETKAPASDSLLEHLGAPVESPANLDAAYSQQGLLAAMQLAAPNAGISLKKVEIENSEFPFLIGVICEPGDFGKLKDQFKAMGAYGYYGSVGDDTCNAFNIVPPRAYPLEGRPRIDRRVTLREQVLCDKLRAQQN